MFMTERELNRLADLIAERLEKRGLCIPEPRNGQALVVEVVDINTMPVSLRGAQAEQPIHPDISHIQGMRSVPER